MIRSTLVLLAAVSVLVGCSGIPLADRDIRKKQITLETKVPGKTAYLRSLAWLNKNLLPLEGSVMEQLAPEGRVVLRTKSKCQLLSPEREAENRFITYKLTLQAADNSAAVLFEDIRMVDETGQALRTEIEQISDEAQMKKIEPCLTAITVPLSKGIRMMKINWE
jgi:hypothetical protein